MTRLIKPGYITLADLTQNGACESQVDRFRATFGATAKITKRNFQTAIKGGLDIFWCTRFLTAPAWAEYERVTAASLAEYERVTAPAWAEYERVTAPAWAEYERVRAPAWAEHERVTAASLAEYERVRAAALFAALTGTPLEMQP